MANAATDGFEALIGGLVAWVVDAVVWVIGGVFNFFLDATDPNVQASWFSGSKASPYGTTASIGATLLVGFVLAAVVQGTLAGDSAGMLRRIAIDLPVSVLGMVGLVAVTQSLIALTDALSTDVLARFEHDIAAFTTVVTSVSRLGGSQATAFVVLLLGLLTVLSGLILVAELAIRAALIYIVVALAPLVFAARLWPAMQHSCRKLLELLCALIVSKLVIAIALSVAAAAAVGSGSGGEVKALPKPEVAAEDPGGSVTQAVGILLAATAAFGVSAFSPMVLMRLLPMAEGAMVAHGVRGGPMRGAQQGMSVANSARSVSTSRQIASKPIGRAAGGGGGATGGGGGAGMSGVGAAAAGPVGAAATVATASVGAARSGAAKAGERATGAIDGAGVAGSGATGARPGNKRTPSDQSRPRPRPPGGSSSPTPVGGQSRAGASRPAQWPRRGGSNGSRT